jgi:hypothetical protein
MTRPPRPQSYIKNMHRVLHRYHEREPGAVEVQGAFNVWHFRRPREAPPPPAKSTRRQRATQVRAAAQLEDKCRLGVLKVDVGVVTLPGLMGLDLPLCSPMMTRGPSSRCVGNGCAGATVAQ